MGQPIETIESVTAWAESTFGPTSMETMLERADTEFEELYSAIMRLKEAPEKIAFEAADVCICLYRIIGLTNPNAIDQKMAINRARKWNVKNGVGQHTTEGGAT